MELTPNLALAIHNRDRKAARVEILAIIDNDFELGDSVALAQACAAAEQFRRHSIELFEADDGRARLPSKEEWNDLLVHKLMAGLDYNFSLERIQQVQEVIAHLRSRQVSAEQTNRTGCEGVLRGMRCRLCLWLAIGAMLAAVGAAAIILIRKL